MMVCMQMRGLAALGILCLRTSSAGSDWNAQGAADYLDGREKAWFDWKTAKSNGRLCLSCHTNVPYLLTRPALRRMLGEPQPTQWEAGLLNALRTRSGARDGTISHFKEPTASQVLGVEAVFAALFLSADSFTSGESKAALNRLWALQIREGDAKGAWRWYDFDVDPYETPDSVFYGALLAEIFEKQQADGG
jgi:squalene-hopene/tetraprenyl-beta-curcumene cyclase